MKRLITIIVMLLVSAGYVLVVNAFEDPDSAIQPDHEDQNVDQRTGPKTVDVYLKRIYLDGETDVNIKPVTILSKEDLWSRFSDWQLVDQNKKKVVFQKEVNDISPLLKADGYFGLSKDNILTIYEGKPNHKKAIHSFYQIDVKALESHLQHRLQNGIPIQTKGHYQKVIKQLKKYAAKKS